MAANNYSRFSLKRLLIFILILLVVFAFSSVNFAFADTESDETAEATEETT